MRSRTFTQNNLKKHSSSEDVSAVLPGTKAPTVAYSLVAVLLALLYGLLFSMPRIRLVIGAPIYFIDLFAVALIALSLIQSPQRWVSKTSLGQLVFAYLIFVIIGEITGMFLYGLIFEPIYMIFRLSIAIALFFTLPRLIQNWRELDMLLIGVACGSLFAALLTMGYSFLATRVLVMSTVFSIEMINPGFESVLRVAEVWTNQSRAMRGRSLVGSATITAAFLAIAWPLCIYAMHRIPTFSLFRMPILASVFAVPAAAILTYGRAAWLMIIISVMLAGIFNLGGMRRYVLLGGFLLAGVLATTTIDRSMFYFERITEESAVLFDNPTEDESVGERLLSYVEPFAFLSENPSWLLVGTGNAGSRATRRGDLGAQYFDEDGLATHSAFAKSFYSYGFLAAICQIMLMAASFFHVYHRLTTSRNSSTSIKLAWQCMMMSWCSLMVWWLSGHAMIGEPRGVVLMFSYLGLLMVFEKIRMHEQNSLKKSLKHQTTD